MALLGRTRELALLRQLVLRDDVRIVTISGAGGSGKTSVALAVAADAAADFANGAAFVELTPVTDADLVVPTVARALGVADTADLPVEEALSVWLAGRELLLVVDNVEHVSEAATSLARLVRRAPRVTLLLTSRRVLHLSGEQVFPLQPLALEDAVALFVARAHARDPDVDVGDATAVQGICRRLDCLPLAIELAAARTAVLAPDALAARLAERVDVLGHGPRDAPARQRTLRDTLRWSTDLLSPGERLALARLSVFRGGCTLEAAESVVTDDLAVLEGLLDAHLLRRLPAGGRLTLLETVREHAAELLDCSGETAAVEAAHARWCAAMAEATPLRRHGTVEGRLAIDAELDNLRAAHERTLASGDPGTALRIATALYGYWVGRALYREGRDRINRALDLAGDKGVIGATALRAVAGIHWLLGERDLAIARARRGVEVGLAAGAVEAMFGCHIVLGIVAMARKEYDEARRELTQSVGYAQQLGFEQGLQVAHQNLGMLELEEGDNEAARRYFRLSAEAVDEQVPPQDRLPPYCGLGSVAGAQGRWDDAQGHFEYALSLYNGSHPTSTSRRWSGSRASPLPAATRPRRAATSPRPTPCNRGPNARAPRSRSGSNRVASRLWCKSTSAGS